MKDVKQIKNKTIEDKGDKEKDNNVIFEKKEYLNYIPVFSGIIYGIAMIIKNISLYFYSIEAERFYGIPSKYFYENVLGDIITKLLWFLLLIIVLISPPIIKKWLKKSRLSFKEAVGYSGLISIVILYVLLLTAIQIIDSFKLDYVNNSMCWGIAILLFIFAVVVFSFYMYMKLFMRDDNKTINNNSVSNQEKKNIDENIDENIDRKTKVSSAIFAGIIILLVMGILFLSYVNVKLPYNTKNYEVMLEGSKAKKIVVGEYKDFYILMDIKEIKHSKQGNNTKDSKLVFYKYYYELKKKENLKIIYINFEQIKNNDNYKINLNN